MCATLYYKLNNFGPVPKLDLLIVQFAAVENLNYGFTNDPSKCAD